MKVVLSKNAQKDLDRLPRNKVIPTSSKIYALANNPFGHGVVKLEGGKGYRIRIGDYRIVYTIDKISKVLTVIKVGHRKKVYR